MRNNKEIPNAGYYCKLSIGFLLVYVISLAIVIGIIAGNVFPGLEPIRYITIIVAIQSILITSCILAIPYTVNKINRIVYDNQVYTEIEIAPNQV